MKRFRRHRVAWALAVLLLAGPIGPAAADLPAPQFVEKFQVPEFDVNGTKKSEIFGDRAEFLNDSQGKPNGKVKITGLKIVIYKEGSVEGTLDSSECIFDRKEKNAISNADVSIHRGSMLVTGKGFRWFSGDQRIEILNDVRVVLQGVPVWIKKEKK